MGDEWTQGPAGRIVSGSGTGSVRRAVRTCDHRLPVAATGTVLLVVLAALLPLGLAAQDPRQIALMRGRIGVDPEPGSLLAAPARVTVSGLPLGEALSRLAERSRIRIAFSPSLLPADRHVDCECATMSMARALDQLLADTDLGYVELGSQVLLVPRAEVGGHATAALAGVVRDSVNLEPVAFAPVTVTPVGGDPGAVSGVSDRYGAFVLPAVPASVPVRIDVGTVGYAWTRTYDVLPAEPIRALLSPIPISLEGLDVFGSGRAGDPMSLSRDAFVIDTVLLRSLPTIPETDVLRATEVAPSASAASDYTSVPFIRGGTSDGTPTLLDGMRLFNAFHLGGLVSAINADVVKRVTVLPGSGGDGLATGSLSGAFDIATRDGSRDRRRTSGSLGLVSSRFSVEGPVGENVSYLIGGRRTWLDGLTKGLTKIGVMKESFPYSFRDVVAKVATDLGGVRRLSVSAYLNSESMSAYLNSESGIIAESTAIRDSTETALTWGNAGFSVHYRDRFGVQGIVDANLGYSRFRGDVFHRWERPLLEDGPNDTLSGAGSMSETRLGLRVTWHAAGATITTGTQATRFLGRHDYHVAEPLRRAGRGGMLSDFLTPLALRGSQWRLAAYSRVEVPLRHGVSTRGGCGWTVSLISPPPSPRSPSWLTRAPGGRCASRDPVPTRRWPRCATRRCC